MLLYNTPSVSLPWNILPHFFLFFIIQKGFTVSVGAIARQWVRRAAICQCLAASRNAEGCTRSLRKGGSLPEEGDERGRESDLLVRLMERADAKERERGDIREKQRWRYAPSSQRCGYVEEMCGLRTVGKTVTVPFRAAT